MKYALLLMLTLLVTACAPVSTPALCTALEAPMNDHAAALLADGGDASVKSGDYLLRLIDAGCA